MTHFKFISLKRAIQIAISHSNRTKKSTKIDLANSLNCISSKEIRSPINLPELDSAGLDGYIISSKKFTKFPVSSKIIKTGKVNSAHEPFAISRSAIIIRSTHQSGKL